MVQTAPKTHVNLRDRTRTHIDYVTINKRFRNRVTKARTLPGADCNSDHVPVVVDRRV